LDINTLGRIESNDSLSDLLHVRSEMKFFQISGENYRFQDDDGPSGYSEEAFIALHLWSSDDIFIYDKDEKNYELAKNYLAPLYNDKGVMIDVWFDSDYHSRTTIEIKWYRKILQMEVDGNLLIKYEDTFADLKEESNSRVNSSGTIAFVGVLLGTIVLIRRNHLRYDTAL
jgi:hypothetical protein